MIELPESLAERWRPIGTRTGETTVLIASITADTTLYAPVEGGEAVTERGRGEIPVRSLFAVDLTVSPPLSAVGISPEAAFPKAAPKAKAQFVETVADDGLTVEGTRDELEFEHATGVAGRWYVLDVVSPLEPDPADDGARIPVEAHVAVWPTEDAYGVAGGLLPLEAPGDAGSGEGLDVAPERDRETIAQLVRSVDPTGER